MTDAYEAKYQEMQKFVPFIQRVIEKLKVNNEQQADKPRRAQLQKMEMLHDLLTNKKNKIKIETLTKCEGVLIKLQTKLEKNEDVILSDVKLKQQESSSKNTKVEETEDLGPASPPPEIIADDIDQPVVIPTERRCSPILIKEREKSPSEKSHHHKKETLDHHSLKETKHSTNADLQDLRKKSFHFDSSSGGSNDNLHVKESQHLKYVNPVRQSSSLVAPEKKLQTIKSVTTEPLPAHIKKQHNPSSSKYIPRSSICHDNLKTLPQARENKDDPNEAYSPEESWEILNDSHKNRSSTKDPSAALVFSRLGARVPENPASSATGRYTPIPDVLKSPPLSASDINNLLIESGADNILNDISEIGTRRPVKTDDHQKDKSLPSNSLDYVRKKLAQTVKLNSCHQDITSRLSDMDTRNISHVPNERLALKYNPHPRQERLQSTSSAGDSDCSSQSKTTNDPRIKLKLHTDTMLHSPTPAPALNVNVLPTINLSDPRLKKQTAAPIPQSTPLALASSKHMTFPNQAFMNYGSGKDPKISCIPSNTSSCYSSEKNWDSNEVKKIRPPFKADPRHLKKDQDRVKYKYENGDKSTSFGHKPPIMRTMISTGRNKFDGDKAPLVGLVQEASASKAYSQSSTDKKEALHKVQKFDIQKIQKDTTLISKNSNQTFKASATFVTPNPPNSDTEEDWDLEQEEPKSTMNVPPPQLPINKLPIVPVIPPYTQISPKGIANPLHSVSAPNEAIHTTPTVHSQYPVISSSNSYHSHLMQNSPSNNRFNSILNDKSERIKYFEAKRKKSNEHRTYKEFREAKERAQAQEVATKRAAEEAEAKKRAEELLKDNSKNKRIKENICDKKEQHTDAMKKADKTEEEKKEKKMHNKDNKRTPTGESTLDKMYRTQNFSPKFPTANSSFKIPKKKTDENPKQDGTNLLKTPDKQTGNLPNPNLGDKIKAHQAEPPSTITKPLPQEFNSDANSSNNDKTAKHADPLTCKEQETNLMVTSEEQQEQLQTSLANLAGDSSAVSSKSIKANNTEENEKNVTAVISDKPSSKQKEEENSEERKERTEESLTEINESKSEADSNKINVRDPRHRPKNTPITTENLTGKEPNNENNYKMFGDIVIKSSENQVILKPQQNLDKFNRLTQALAFKHQRVLRRRNTMVVFDSAPLVDKEVLKNANALLFEDVQEQEKRKHNQAEEDKLNARRNKQLEEMFKKTDDNCTVSTQNIIIGKRRTRATINFNETVNAMNVFKHKSVKDTSLGNITTTPPPVAPTIKATKCKFKNVALLDPKCDESEDDKNVKTLARKGAKKVSKPDVSQDTKLKAATKTEFSRQTKPIAKLVKKRATVKRRTSSTNNPIESPQTSIVNNDEYQNCNVSSTSTDNYALDDTTFSLISTNGSFTKDSDDKEPTSTTSKSNEPTPMPGPNSTVLSENVDQEDLKPNAHMQHLFEFLGQNLSEASLGLIKPLRQNRNSQNDDEPTNCDELDNQSALEEKKFSKNKDHETNQPPEYEDEEEEGAKLVKSAKTDIGKKMLTQKKKRSELDRLNEDIKEMYICEGVLTATGRRMCTVTGKDIAIASGVNKKSSKASLSSPVHEQVKIKEELLKPPIVTRALRRSIRRCKATEDNDDDEVQSTVSRTTDESVDEPITATATTPQRKMPILKPNTPITTPEEEEATKVPKTKASANKRKAERNFNCKSKKPKINKDDSKENSQLEGKASETEAAHNRSSIKNTNIHWHHQSKYANWCMICEKRIPSTSSSIHYKRYHRENYISRLAPLLLQQFKKGKLNQPLFGVKKAQKPPSWFYRCPFCLKYFNTSMSLWLEHFQNHTVEFRYECSKCHCCSNRRITIFRHIKSCAGAALITAAVKLKLPNVINAHVCHLCNFIQLKRNNLERHYIEQHQLEEKTVELLGYTIKLFDVDNVDLVSEENAADREKKAWKSIEKDEQVIDIDYDQESFSPSCVHSTTEVESASENTAEKEESQRKTPKPKNKAEEPTGSLEKHKEKSKMLQNTKGTPGKKSKHDVDCNQLQTANFDKDSNLANQQRTDEEMQEAESAKKDTLTADPDKEKPTEEREVELQREKIMRTTSKQESQHFAAPDENIATSELSENVSSNDFEVIIEKENVQDVQDELLELAAKAAEGYNENNECSSKEKESAKETPNHRVANENLRTTCANNPAGSETQITNSDIISSSIDMIYKRGCAVANIAHPESKDVFKTASNVFMPSRDENNYSPTIQILAQSIINIEEEEEENESIRDKPITIAERLSQRFKDFQNKISVTEKSNTICSTASPKAKSVNDNVLVKLVNDTLLELTRERDSVNDRYSNQTPAETPTAPLTQHNAFAKLLSETSLQMEKDKDAECAKHIMQQQQITNIAKDAPTIDATVLSDDEDWEDIEITETAPKTSATNPSNMQKSKSKGLFQKFGIFKTNNTKSKKHLPPMVFLPKKKTKEKTFIQSHITTTTTTTTTTAPPTTASVSTTKVNENIAVTSISSNNSIGHLGFKPLANIMDGLFPDSPSNDPIDLVPELAPLEPLQDLNDISSILDSNLSAVNINAADNHTSIEDALDFISEQQANDKQKSNSLALSLVPSQSKTIINNISHVGFSAQVADEISFKFYCLLQNCSFLYSSDSVGLENHFMCEHSQIKWNGYCLMCQAQCFPNADASEEHSISKEIRHMMEKHANKPAPDLNTDSTQHSTTSSQDNEERPKIKLRRLTGDCLSRATPENVSSNEAVPSIVTSTPPLPMSMLGALLVADPRPPTKEMPPQPQMPFTEPLLLGNGSRVSPQLTFRNISNDFFITSVTSAAPKSNETPLQISSVISLNINKTMPSLTESEQVQIPKITNVRTLAPKADSLWSSQQVEKDRMALSEASAESQEVSRILEKVGRPPADKEVSRSANDSPVLVAETVPLAQSKTGDFVVTQTVSAQYDESSSAALGFNISIAASTTGDGVHAESALPNSTSITSRQYKCMGNGCKFVSRVPVAMSDHLRFHERRNFSNVREYLSCGFCSYSASDVEDYMKHANQFHIINSNKGGALPYSTTSNETDTATSLTRKIQSILSGSNNNSTVPNRNLAEGDQQNQTAQLHDSEEVYLKKLRATIEEIVAPTGLADDKLYRCVIKGCQSQLNESTFLSHIMFHITTTGGNPNSYVFKCPHCTAQYHRPAGIKAHIKNHARNRYFCYLCDETSTNPGQLLKHFSEKHWHTLNMYTKELLQPKLSTDGSDCVLDSSYYVAYTQDLSAEEVRKFGEKLILEWQRKKSGSKTHFKSTEIDLLPLSAIFQRQVNCGECEYKTKVRTNMFRHLLMHKQNPGLANKSGVSKTLCSVDPVNPVPCLNSTERFFDKMTNLASSSLVPSSSSTVPSTTRSSFKIPQAFVEETKRYTCGCPGCNYHTISEDLFRTHLATLHSTAMSYCCLFCQEEICKRGILIDRIMNHTRFHGVTIYRCEECNYVHHLRYVVERHVNEKHSTMKVNIVTHNRSTEDCVEGTTTALPFTGKKYREGVEISQSAQASSTSIRSANGEKSGPKSNSTHVNNAKSKGKWLCDVCGYRASTVVQIQTHCQQQHGNKNQYKCAHCNFGSQQLSQILHHIDEKHSGKTREARYMYHKAVNSGEEMADTRPLWQRNDPTRIRHIRGILMEDEEESEEYRRKLALTEDVDDDSNENQHDEAEENGDHLNTTSYTAGYEFGCYHCPFKTQAFEDLKSQHYEQSHNYSLEMARPFWYRLHRRLCCPECLSFVGSSNELQQHLEITHKKSRYYAADIKMAESGDTSQRILCGYCSFHCVNADHLYRHHLKSQHQPQDLRIDNNEQIMRLLALGKAETSYQCTSCSDIYPNRVAIVQHACQVHAGEDSFSFRELSNSLVYRCNACCFTSTTEIELMRHTINHYNSFKVCSFCSEPQSSFNVYMQHCYAEHRNDIQKFKTIYPLTEIRKFLLQTLIVFPNGLVLNKRNLLNTKYGRTDVIDEIYEEIYKISQQPPIPRLSIARLVARKSIEAQQKHVDFLPTAPQEGVVENVCKRRCTEAFNLQDLDTNANSLVNPKFAIVETKKPANIARRRTTVDHDKQQQEQQKHNEFSAPHQLNRISKRRRTVAVDRLLIESQSSGKKQKISNAHEHTASPKHTEGKYPTNLAIEPFSFYGKPPEDLDLTKIYTKVAIGSIITPLTIDKFKLLFNIDCQLKLTKCDEISRLVASSHNKQYSRACPASHKLKHN